MKNIKYLFTVIRYYHDAVTQEFANTGIIMYSQEANYLRAKCTEKFGRISRMFSTIDGTQFRRVSKAIQMRINEISDALDSENANGKEFSELLAEVMPPDESSIRFSDIAAGITEDLDEALDELFERYISIYIDSKNRSKRTDSQVWRTFKSRLDKRLQSQLKPKTIEISDVKFKFEHVAKNGKLHICQPVSLDLSDEDSIISKAINWIGTSEVLEQSPEEYKLHLLLAEPKEEKLKSAYTKAKTILSKSAKSSDIYDESEADKFAEDLAKSFQHIA